MQIKDLSVSVESLEDVRGGSADAYNESYIGDVDSTATISVGGSGPTNLSGSGIGLSNVVLAQNGVAQNATASDSRVEQFALQIDRSVFDFSFPV